MQRRTIRWTGYHVPVSTFTQAVRVPADADLLFISGITARTADGTLIDSDDVGTQARQILENIRGILAEVGAGMEHVVKTTAFVMNADQIEEYRAVRDEFFGSEPPASSIVEVSRLYDPRMLVEVEAIAMLPPTGRDDRADRT